MRERDAVQPAWGQKPRLALLVIVRLGFQQRKYAKVMPSRDTLRISLIFTVKQMHLRGSDGTIPHTLTLRPPRSVADDVPATLLRRDTNSAKLLVIRGAVSC